MERGQRIIRDRIRGKLSGLIFRENPERGERGASNGLGLNLEEGGRERLRRKCRFLILTTSLCCKTAGSNCLSFDLVGPHTLLMGLVSRPAKNQ